MRFDENTDRWLAKQIRKLSGKPKKKRKKKRREKNRRAKRKLDSQRTAPCPELPATRARGEVDEI